MELNFPQILQIAAGVNVCAAVLLSFRTLQSRTGLWAVLLGLGLGVSGASLGLFAQYGATHWALLWWLGWLLLPALLLPLSVAVANIGLLRQMLLLVNGVLALAALGFGVWLRGQWQSVDAPWGYDLRLPAAATLLLAWAGTLWLAAVLDTLLQWVRRNKPQDRQRMGILLFVLLALGLAWAVDAAWFFGRGLQPWGLFISTPAYLVLFVLLWLKPGPRRISGTITPDIIHASKQPLIIADGEGRIQATNPAAIRLLERRRYQVLGQDLVQVLGLDVDYLDTATRLHGAGYVERVSIAVKSVKAVREVAVQPVILRAADGEVLAVICTLNPGSEDPALAATSLQDPVTGLAGAALGEALIAQELRRHAGGSGALVAAIFVRLDDAGVIASRHGQALHDRLQNAVAERLAAVCDWPLDLARTSGGGYLLLLTQVNDREEVLAIARRAQDLLGRPYKLDQQELHPPVLVTVLPDLRIYHELIDVLVDARHGQEQARHQPGEPFVTEQRAKDRVNLALALETAIATDALDLRLEPVVDLRTETTVGVQARMQWMPDGMPVLHDDELRRLARRVHLEGPLNQWRLQRLAQLQGPKAWAVWIQVDPQELQSRSFVKAFPKAVTRLPFKLMLEMSDAIWQLPACRKIARALSEAGMGLHASDFSSGSQVVTHGADLAARTAALDARLVQLHTPASDAVVRGLAGTAEILSCTLRAAGVRKKADVERLRALGVGLAMGEYFSPEFGAQDLSTWLRNEAALKRKFEGTAPALVAARGERRRPTLG